MGRGINNIKFNHITPNMIKDRQNGMKIFDICKKYNVSYTTYVKYTDKYNRIQHPFVEKAKLPVAANDMPAEDVPDEFVEIGISPKEYLKVFNEKQELEQIVRESNIQIRGLHEKNRVNEQVQEMSNNLTKLNQTLYEKNHKLKCLMYSFTVVMSDLLKETVDFNHD